MKKISLILFAALIVAGSLFLIKKSRRPNVLVVLIDTLRADHLSFNSYERKTTPFIDNFAAENLNFTRAISASSWTPPSIASLFSGMYPVVHGHMPLRSETEYGKRFTKLDDSFVTLAELFQKSGYNTALISANPIVSKKYGFSQGFDMFISPGREDGEKVNQRAKKFLSDLRDKNKPFFLYLQYMDPHDPYEPNPPHDKQFTGKLASRSYPEIQSDFINKYDGEIAYIDKKIEALFSWLKESGLYDDTIILLTSDHGEQFLERGYQGHADRTYLEEAHIPLILKAEDRQGVEDSTVSLVDAFPTILEAAGIEIDHLVHGYSLLSGLEKRRKEGVMSEIIRHVNEKSYTTPEGVRLVVEYKMDKGVSVPMDELIGGAGVISSKVFDINKDPFEINPLTDPGLKGDLEKKFSLLYKRILHLRDLYQRGDVELDEKSIEELKTLGYI